MFTARIVRWGNSLAVRLPKPLAQQAGIQEGDSVVVEAESCQIRIKRKKRVPSLKQLVAQITPENRYGETPWGPERGKERIEW